MLLSINDVKYYLLHLKLTKPFNKFAVIRLSYISSKIIKLSLGI